MRLTTEQERMFFDAVKKGAVVLCAPDVYDALKARGIKHDFELCKYLEAGTVVAVDRKLFLPPAVPLIEYWDQTLKVKYDDGADDDLILRSRQ